MPNNNKRRGDALEYEVVKAFQAHDIEAERARGSDGRAIGLHQEVDCVARNVRGHRDLTIQCKRRKNLADYLTCENTDIVVVRKDGRGHQRLYVIPEDVLFELIGGR